MQKSLLISFLFFIFVQPFAFSASRSDSLEFRHGNYRQIETTPSVFLSPLPDKIKETSGLIFWRNSLWTHNDSGGKPEIYKIDTATGKITQTILFEGVINFDWEDITQDDQFIYVGDFGNNGGERKDLCIFKIPKASIPLNGKGVSLTPEKINFSFADQKSFENNFRHNNYDCESFFAFGDSLFIFSKNWGDGNTRLYILPKLAGDYAVSPRSSFFADGLICGADINPARSEVALVGYKDFQSFMWLFWDFKGNDFFDGEKLRIDFPDLVFVQSEGIAYLDNDNIFFSCEKSAIPPSVFEVKSSALKAIADNLQVGYQPSKIVISEIRSSFSNKVTFDIISLPASHFSVELYDKRWRKLFSEKHKMMDEKTPYSIEIPIVKHKAGTYFIKIISGSQSLVRKIKIEN